jgi:hypothetical protein
MNTTITKSALWLVVSLSACSVWSQAASGPLSLEHAGGPVVISKVPVADCRVARGDSVLLPRRVPETIHGGGRDRMVPDET